MRIQHGLQVFRCEIARLNADLSAIEPALACLRAKFGREDTGPLSDEERAALAIAGAWPDERSALGFIEQAGLSLAPRARSAATGGPADAPSVFHLDPIAFPARNTTCILEPNGKFVRPRCVDAAGAEVRVTPQDFRGVFVQLGLRYIGCSTSRLNGDVTGDIAAINCFHELFGTRRGALDIVQTTALATAGGMASSENAFEHLASKGFVPVGFVRPSDLPAPEIMARVIHLEGAKFIHPRNEIGFLTAKVDVFTRLHHGTGGGDEGIFVRWANPAEFAGRTFSIMNGDRPLLLLELGDRSAVATDADGMTSEGVYTTRAMFTCMPDPGGWNGACVGISLWSQTQDQSVWTLAAALHHSDPRGRVQPLSFGELVKGRAAWDAAIARDEAARAALAAQLSAGGELEALPLHDLPRANAWFIGRTYDSPFLEEAEWPGIRFTPYIAYHAAYARACAGSFDGAAVNWVDVRIGLRDVQDTGLIRTEVWETYIAREIPVQAAYHERFGAAINLMVQGAATDPSSAAGPQLMVDFLKMLEVVRLI